MWRMFQGVRDLRQESRPQVWVSAANGGQKKQAISTVAGLGAGMSCLLVCVSVTGLIV